MAMIFAFSTENAEQSDRRSGTFSTLVLKVTCPDYDSLTPEGQKAAYDSVQHLVRKCAHFIEYMMLGFALRLCLESWFGHRAKKQGALYAGAAGLGAAYAGTDEIHQLAIDGRSGQWTDVLVDASGVLAGAALAGLLIRLIQGKAAR